MQTSWAGFFVGVFSKKSDGLLRLSAPCLYVCNLVCRLLKPASVLGRLGVGCDGWVSSVGLARFVPAVALKHVKVVGTVEFRPQSGFSAETWDRRRDVSYFCEHGDDLVVIKTGFGNFSDFLPQLLIASGRVVASGSLT